MALTLHRLAYVWPDEWHILTTFMTVDTVIRVDHKKPLSEGADGRRQLTGDTEHAESNHSIGQSPVTVSDLSISANTLEMQTDTPSEGIAELPSTMQIDTPCLTSAELTSMRTVTPGKRHNCVHVLLQSCPGKFYESIIMTAMSASCVCVT